MCINVCIQQRRPDRWTHPAQPNQTKPNPPPTTIQIAWNDPANPAVGFKYLYLSPEDYEVRRAGSACVAWLVWFWVLGGRGG